MSTHHIKILGSGCANCQALETNTRRAVDQLGLDATIDKITDDVAIAGHGVMATPGLVIDDQVISTGRVPTADQIAALIGRATTG